jgi:two-component system response regulator AlgR
MLRVLVVDDEPPARARLAQILQDCAPQIELELLGEAAGGLEAIALAGELHPDVVLLDIAMPGMNGIEVARHLALTTPPPAVIFVTAFDEHALQAFEVQALDYLMKPVRAERLLAALRRAGRLLPREPRLEALAEKLGTARTHLPVSERGRLVLVPLDEVLYLRAELKYVTIRTAEREFLTEEPLTGLETEFAERFVRIHRNCLVARQALAGFERVRPRADAEEEGAGAEGHWEVMLRGVPERLAVSRRQWAAVKSVMGL